MEMFEIQLTYSTSITKNIIYSKPDYVPTILVLGQFVTNVGYSDYTVAKAQQPHFLD